MKKLITMLLVCCMVLSVFGAFPVFAEQTVIYEDDYDSVAAGEAPTGIAVTENAEKQGLVRCVKEGRNGMVYIHHAEGCGCGSQTGPNMSYTIDLSAHKGILVTFKAKSNGTNPTFELYSEKPKQSTALWSAEASDWVEVQVVIDLVNKAYETTVNGKKTKGAIHVIEDLKTCRLRFNAGVPKPGQGAYIDEVKFISDDTLGGAVTGVEAAKPAEPTEVKVPFVPTTAPKNSVRIPSDAYVFLNTDFSDAKVGAAGDYVLSDGTKPYGTTAYTEIADAGENRLLRYWATDGKSHGPRLQLSLASADSFAVDYAVIPSKSDTFLTVVTDGVNSASIALVKPGADGVNANDWNYVHAEIDLKKLKVTGTVNGQKFDPVELPEITDKSGTLLYLNSVLKKNDVIYYDNVAFYATSEISNPLMGNQQILWQAVKPEKPLGENSFVNNLKAHPRLFVRDWDEMREKVHMDYITEQLYAKIKAAADEALVTQPTAYVINSRGNALESCRLARARIMSLAFCYKIEGDKRYLDRAYEEMLIYGAWENWSQFESTLVTAELLQGYAFAYDWLYDDLTKQQRDAIFAIVQKHALPDFIYNYEGVTTTTNFTTGDINWNPVCNASMIAMALAMADDQPVISEYFLEKVPPFIQNALAPYAPQGGYPEGVSYWDYGTGFLVFANDFLENAFVEGFELPESYSYWKAPGIADTTDFGIYYNGPTGRFNYGDCVSGRGGCEVMYWAAMRFDKPHYAWWMNNIQMQSDSFIGGSGYEGVAALSWYDPDKAYLTPGAFTLDKFYSSENTVNGMSMRSSWEDATALFAAMQGGNNNSNHQYNSLGTYVIDWHGKRFVEQNGQYDYALKGGRAGIYYKRAEGSNTLVISPYATAEDQNPFAVAQVIKSGTSENTAFGIMDMQEVYSDIKTADGSPLVTSAKRGMLLTDNRSRVIVQDEITTVAPTEYYWFANTDASVKISADGKSAMLTIGDERMLARIIEGPADAKFSIMDRKSLIEGVTNTISGKKLAIHLENTQNLTLAVEYVALKQGEGVPAPWAFTPMDAWTALDNETTTAALAGDAVVLKLNTPNAIANGEKTFVDTINTDVVPFTENGRTLVPVRFISESFGAKVGWDAITQTVTVNYQGKEIKLVIGSNQMLVNGESVMLDVPANTYNSRTLIPLRALVEALGKHVFWDDRGLIVITDTQVSYSEETLQKLMTELNVRVTVDGKDIAFFATDKTEYAIDVAEGQALPQIGITTIGGESVAVNQAAALGENAYVSIDGKLYAFKLQTDPFAGRVGNLDAGAISDISVKAADGKLPEHLTYIYVEDLTDSTGFATYPKRGIVDGVINELVANRWAVSGEGWIQMDFGSAKNVHSMAFAGVSQDVRAYNFDVEVSLDATNWTKVHTGGAPATTEKMSIISLGDVQARYVRITGYGSDKSAWNTYAEVRFYENAAQQAEDISYWPVYFGQSGITGAPGTSLQLAVRGIDASRTEFNLRADAQITYEISDPSIASVSADGKITFLKAGTATLKVTATQDGFGASVSAEVVCK